jgi:hypothetical protein
LIVDPKLNGGDQLSLEHLNMIVMDFHGFAQEFA